MVERRDRTSPSGSSERKARAAPHQTARTQAEKAEREARLAAEMRENLRKRKRQQRARDDRKPAAD
jgi:hypothetical protein